MPAPDTSYRSPNPRPRAPQQGQNRPAPRKPLTQEEQIKKELTFSISLQRIREAVDHGWKCVWDQSPNRSYEGYCVGIDREYFVVFEPTEVWNEEENKAMPIAREHLVSRGLNSGITIYPEHLIVDEPSYTQMSERYEKYRKWMVTTYAKGPADPTAQPPRTGQPANRDVPRNWAPAPGATTRGPYSPAFSDNRRV